MAPPSAGYSSLPGASSSRLVLNPDPALGDGGGDESDDLDRSEQGRRARAASERLTSGSENEAAGLLAKEREDGAHDERLEGDEDGLLEGELREMDELEEEGARKAGDRHTPWYKLVSAQSSIVVVHAAVRGGCVSIACKRQAPGLIGPPSPSQQFDRSLVLLVLLALGAGATIGLLYNKYGSGDSHGMKHASAKEAEDYYSGTGLEAGTFTDDAVLADNPIPEGSA